MNDLGAIPEPLVPSRPLGAIGALVVELDAEAEAFGRWVGDTRQGNRKPNGRRNFNVGVLSDDDVDHVGGLAEVAVCRAYGLPLTEARVDPDLYSPDVGGVDVRGTTWRTGGLLLHPKDADDRAHVLVIVGSPCRIIGWTFGHQGKRPEHWASNLPRPCYRVPQSALFDPAWLPIRRPDA